MVIRDEAAARRLLEAALQASGLLDRALAEVQPLLTDAEFAEARRGVGKVMGELHCEVVGPLWKQHPKLAPDD